MQKVQLALTLTSSLALALVCSACGDDENSKTDNGAAGEANQDCVPEILEDSLLDNDYTLEAHTCWIVDGNRTIEHTLTVEEGVTITVQQGHRINVQGEGRLTFAGTAADPITVTGAEEVAGYWLGINVETVGSANTWSYVTIEYAGSDGHNGNSDSAAAVFVGEDGGLAMDHVTIRESGWYALIAQGELDSLSGFSENTFTDNERLMRVTPDLLGSFDSASTFSDNTENFVRSPWSNTNEVTHAQTWENLSAPLLFETRVRVKADVEIAAGAQIQFTQDGSIEVGEASDPVGSISTNGTAAEPVVFTAQDEIVGFYQGIRFFTTSSSNVLTHTELNFAGSENWTGNADSIGSLYIDEDASVTLDNVSVTSSGGYGIVLVENGTLSCTDVSFSDNTDGNVFDFASDSVLTDCP